MIYIISTPIGNLKDISIRAIDTLKEVDLILAEDTRRTSVLLQNYNIKTKMISYNDHNKERRTRELEQQLKTQNIALVSDAGTPGISDPGFYLVRYCVQNNIKTIPIPGASAVLSALVCSGLPTDKFTFLGFIPKGPGRKKKFIESIPDMTSILYESPYRIIDTLEVMSLVIPERNIAIGRELTKKFEEFIRGKPSEVLKKFENKIPKGEFVIVVGK